MLKEPRVANALILSDVQTSKQRGRIAINTEVQLTSAGIHTTTVNLPRIPCRTQGLITFTFSN